MTTEKDRHLVVAHYHLRPGGVRRVIEYTLPAIVKKLGIRSVTFAVGELPEQEWWDGLARIVGEEVEMRVEVRREFLYWSEISPIDGGYAGRVTEECEKLLVGVGEVILWAHNLGLGRNALLAAAWNRAVEKTGAVFLSHHHDFFFDNRWGRWKEMRDSGCEDTGDAAEAVFPVGRRIVHLAINRADYDLLAAGFGERAMWLPNPVVFSAGTQMENRERASEWLAAKTGERVPFWLMPCRLLRRKNVGEALLLARWLRPEVRVVTTGGITSVDERPYFEKIRNAAERNGWRLNMGVLAGEVGAPSVASLMGEAEAVMLTSLQEGFGLPYIEAAVEGRPLIARALSNVFPDLVGMGLEVATVYDEVLIPCSLFDLEAEIGRQRELFAKWLGAIPRDAAQFAGEPSLLVETVGRVAFNRLTLTAQIEVLSRSNADISAALQEVNPKLAEWRGVGERLPIARLREDAKRELSPKRFAEHFETAVKRAFDAPIVPSEASKRVIKEFFIDRLRGENQYPILFASET